MPWKTMEAEEQKVRFVEAATREEKSLTALCEEFGISRPTGYLWWKRYREAGLAGIAERSRQPKRSPRRTAAGWEQRVVELRQRYPDWGARKLQVLLAGEQIELTRSTIHRILLRQAGGPLKPGFGLSGVAAPQNPSRPLQSPSTIGVPWMVPASPSCWRHFWDLTPDA